MADENRADPKSAPDTATSNYLSSLNDEDPIEEYVPSMSSAAAEARYLLDNDGDDNAKCDALRVLTEAVESHLKQNPDG